MKLRRLKVSGFRSLVEFQIDFDDALTVVVGENDAGKTSLIECLRVVTEGRAISVDDFTYGANEISITVEIDDFSFEKTYINESGSILENPLQAVPTPDYVERTRETLERPDLDVETEASQTFIKKVAKLFGLPVRSNSNIENLRRQLIDRLVSDDDILIDGADFPKFDNIQLDGRQFENVPAFFKEVFLKEKQASLWQERLTDGRTIEELVRANLTTYSTEISQQIHERGILDSLRLFLSDLTEVKVEPIFQAKDLSVDAKVKFLENGNEINIEKMGDGTKRRITMALLEFKRGQSSVANPGHTVYLLDEPDTHLHVRAQLDLVRTVEGFSGSGNQVILTTHSPFVVNAAKPSQIRLLTRNNGSTSVRSLITNPDYSSRLLRALGVENTHLFFSRTILIVEGETEENFVPAYYLQRTGHMISSGLIKVINVKGVQNIPGFARAILELHDQNRIFVLCDNDASSELQALIDALRLPSGRKFQVGANEFEDAFSSATLYQVWSEYHSDCGRDCPAGWTEAAIEQLKLDVAADGRKFSSALRQLNRGGKAMPKPVFGTALGERINHVDLPPLLSDLFRELIDA